MKREGELRGQPLLWLAGMRGADEAGDAVGALSKEP